ncbi:acyl carrier protein [Klebsiella pneumoniae]|uniref:Acyl carrier protein n=1 Tax=Klebsiella pneumoniae TaxID=573 RepID=A0A5C2LKP8_KLEPN|nr:acyl carrier protein [Klebsiella pneumoniae]
MPRLIRRLSQPNPRQLPGNPALEKQVAELWQSLLSRPVARHHDFFELGGDSLMATRMVAQLNRRGIAGANLQDLFSHSTLSDFCAHLQAATSGEDNPIPLCGATVRKPCLSSTLQTAISAHGCRSLAR